MTGITVLEGLIATGIIFLLWCLWNFRRASQGEAHGGLMRIQVGEERRNQPPVPSRPTAQRSAKPNADKHYRAMAFALCCLFLLTIRAVGQEPATSDTETQSAASAAEFASDSAQASSLDNPSPQKNSFFHRLVRAYDQDWKGTTPASPDAPRRIPPSPLDSPPFPNSDWSYGGAPVIGAPDTSVYPLMQALYDGPSGEAWKRSRVKIYGWLEPGFNFSTSKDIVFPMSYNIFANRLVLDQAVLRVERIPDTVQTDHVDWGFNVTQFYGTDYRFTTSKGYFSQQLLKFNRQYGYDPVLMYADVYIPHIAKGLNIRVGRYISIPDIEAQLATSNYTYTHSLLFTTDPFTQTGILGTLKLNDRWLLQAGVHASNDTAPWVSDARPSLTACVGYTFNGGNDFLYPCVNGINGGEYAFNNVQHFVVTHYHKFNQSWHTATEAWYMYERNVPAVGGPITPTPGGNPAFCRPGEIRCFTDEWALANYVLKQFDKKNYLSIRNEVLADLKGQRTGFKTTYSEHELMWGHWIGSTVLFRPGLRFEHSYDVPAYDSGKKQTQFSLTMDVVFRY